VANKIIITAGREIKKKRL